MSHLMVCMCFFLFFVEFIAHTLAHKTKRKQFWSLQNLVIKNVFIQDKLSIIKLQCIDPYWSWNIVDQPLKNQALTIIQNFTRSVITLYLWKLPQEWRPEGYTCSYKGSIILTANSVDFYPSHYFQNWLNMMAWFRLDNIPWLQIG